MTRIIKTPVEGYTGIVAGVAFRDGTGVADGSVDYFLRHGYTVTEAETEAVAKATAATEPDEAPDPKAAPARGKPTGKADK